MDNKKLEEHILSILKDEKITKFFSLSTEEFWEYFIPLKEIDDYVNIATINIATLIFYFSFTAG